MPHLSTPAQEIEPSSSPTSPVSSPRYPRQKSFSHTFHHTIHYTFHHIHPPLARPPTSHETQSHPSRCQYTLAFQTPLPPNPRPLHSKCPPLVHLRSLQLTPPRSIRNHAVLSLSTFQPSQVHPSSSVHPTHLRNPFRHTTWRAPPYVATHIARWPHVMTLTALSTCMVNIASIVMSIRATLWQERYQTRVRTSHVVRPAVGTRRRRVCGTA